MGNESNQKEYVSNSEQEELDQADKCDGAAENSEDTTEESNGPAVIEIHPLVRVTSRFLHSINDVEEATRVFVPMAYEMDEKQRDEITDAFDLVKDSKGDDNPQNQMHNLSIALSTTRKAKRYVNARVPDTLVKSLFLNVFSDFDTFTGELLTSLYKIKPELFNGISKDVPLNEIIKFDDIEVLKEKILNEEIETFRRKSYIEQFEELEKQFKLGTLRKFPNWPKFVEATQRRNLFMHCDAIVSEQYLKICRQNDVDLAGVEVGDRLELDEDYMKSVLNVMSEVAIKLSSVLWRKVLPEEKEESDDALHNYVFDELNKENWELAIVVADFVNTVAKPATEMMARINVINLAIAQKFSGNDKLAQKVLSAKDWTATILDFRLAVSVLQRDFDEAYELMLKIGKESELVCESAYIEWPLFKEFRETEQLSKAYKSIYGYSFITKVRENANEFEKEVDELQQDMFNHIELDEQDNDQSNVSTLHVVPNDDIKHSEEDISHEKETKE